MPEVKINRKRIKQIATVVATLPTRASLNFYSVTDREGKELVLRDMYPSTDAPRNNVINFFCFVGWNNFGFWLRDEKGYVAPLYGTLGGKQNIKGSDLLWRLAKRAFDKNPEVFSPFRCSPPLRRHEWMAIMSDDNGPVPLLATDERYEMYLRYVSSFVENGISPTALVDRAQATTNPIEWFLASFGCIPGYKEDPLKKKAILLAMALANRPEKFLTAPHSFSWPTIVDTHLQRIALRQGLITLPKAWEKENTERLHTSVSRERAIRMATAQAIEEVIKHSDRTMPEVDVIFWMARKYCPEMQVPECASCKFANACAKRTELFQPILETTAY